MENMNYGNWVRTKVLWFLGIITLVFGAFVLVRVPTEFRIFFGILALGSLVSFLFPMYSYFMFSHKGGNMQDKFYDLILAPLENHNRGKMLVIGAGNGILATKAAIRNPALDVVGMDYWGKDWEYSKTVCEQNARVGKVADRAHFQKGDAASLNFPDATFDIVVSNLTFHEVKMVKRKNEVLQEALRVLKPGGKFVFIDYFYEDRYYGNVEDFKHSLESLPLQEVALKPLHDVMTVSRLLRHPRALGRVGIVLGRK